MFVQKMGDYCEFHITKAYKQSKSRRSHLQAPVPTEPLKEKQRRAQMIESNQNKFVIYNGKQRLYDAPGAKQRQHLSKRPSSFSIKVNSAPARDMDIDQSTGSSACAAVSNPSFEDLLKRPTLGALNLKRSLDDPNDSGGVFASPAEKRRAPEKITARDLLDQHSQKVKRQKTSDSDDIVLQFEGDTSSRKNILANNFSASRGSVTLEELKKMRAAAKLSSCSQNKENKRKEQITNRVAENRHFSIRNESLTSNREQQAEANSGTSNDLVRSVLNLKSKFSTELDNIEKEHEEKYFQSREKKEQIEERLAATMEVKVRAVTCRTCWLVV